MTLPIQCAGSGPHDPGDGVLGKSDRPVGGLLCPPCAAVAHASAPPTGPAPPDLVTLADDMAEQKARMAAAEDALNFLILEALGGF